MDQHKVTSWCFVAKKAVRTLSILKLSEATTTTNKEHGTPHKNPDLKWYKALSNASSYSSQLRSRLALGSGTGALPARETKRRVTTAHRHLDWLHVSTPVGMSSQTEEIIAASLTHMEKPSICKRPEGTRNYIKCGQKLDAIPMRGLCTRLGTSWQDVARPTSNSQPKSPATQANASPGWEAGSPEELNTKTQKPHDAIFLFERTSLSEQTVN